MISLRESEKDFQLLKVMEFHIRRVANTCGRSSLQIREFFDSRGHLSMSNGFLTYDDRIVIPADMREEIRSAFTQVTRI